MSGDDLVGTTILEGIREVAPDANITFSADASAPMDGADVGIVVVGETPYSEGFGDIDGPEWQFGDPELREEKSLSLLPGDRAVVDAVCGAIETCVVLLVSGRPQVITDQLGQMDALVASWLPGSEGAGVADVLFGNEPFTGRLSVTWPRSEDQVPINVGDRGYRAAVPLRMGAADAGVRPPLGGIPPRRDELAVVAGSVSGEVRTWGAHLTRADQIDAHVTRSARHRPKLGSVGVASSPAEHPSLTRRQGTR